MIKDIDNYFMQKEEPVAGCLLALRHLILGQNPRVSEVWRYRMPFYCYMSEKEKEKRFCYLWTDKKNGLPYIGIVEGKRIEHPDLISEKRSRMKIMFIDPESDLPVEKINHILQQAIGLCQQ